MNAFGRLLSLRTALRMAPWGLAALLVLALAGPAYAPWCEWTALKHFKAGNELLDKGEVEGAIDEYQQALSANTEFATTLFDNALAEYGKEIGGNGDDGTLYFRMGVIHFAKSEYAKAWESAKAAAEKGYEIQPVFIKMLKEEAPWLEAKENGSR